MVAAWVPGRIPVHQDAIPLRVRRDLVHTWNLQFVLPHVRPPTATPGLHPLRYSNISSSAILKRPFALTACSPPFAKWKFSPA